MHMINLPSSRDHDEIDLGVAAGISDKGLRHHRNEDAMAVALEQTAAGPVYVTVVCDGVSSSARPDEASEAAAQAALPILVNAVRAGEDLAAASLAAVQAGREAIAGLAEVGGDSSATTFVSAVAEPAGVTVCWLGDSRVYWLAQPVAESRQLTMDDSVAGGLVAAGLATEAAAMASPHAHVLTRWLDGEAPDPAGQDPDRAAHVERFVLPGPGVLLLCSDGLWNYSPEPAALAGLALPKAMTDPVGAAADLVKFALDAGGADNITVVMVLYAAVEQAAVADTDSVDGVTPPGAAAS